MPYQRLCASTSHSARLRDRVHDGGRRHAEGRLARLIPKLCFDPFPHCRPNRRPPTLSLLGQKKSVGHIRGETGGDV